jgi:hypothetical protein
MNRRTQWVLSALAVSLVIVAGYLLARPEVQPAPSKDADGAGVQLELASALRLELFPAKDGPASTRGLAFVAAVRSVYA